MASSELSVPQKKTLTGESGHPNTYGLLSGDQDGGSFNMGIHIPCESYEEFPCHMILIAFLTYFIIIFHPFKSLKPYYSHVGSYFLNIYHIL